MMNHKETELVFFVFCEELLWTVKFKKNVNNRANFPFNDNKYTIENLCEWAIKYVQLPAWTLKFNSKRY